MGPLACRANAGTLTPPVPASLPSAACLQAARLVRQLRGHTAAVSDMQISEDCRWLLSSSLDGTVRCWDIPGGWWGRSAAHPPLLPRLCRWRHPSTAPLLPVCITSCQCIASCHPTPSCLGNDGDVSFV